MTAAVASERQHRHTTTSIGTVLALRSVTLRNELPGTVREVTLTPGQIVDAGTVLVALDVSVEEAELKAQQAQAALAETVLRRVERLDRSRVTAEMELDRARAERDVALAQIARTKAIMARKTIRAPFRARVGLADLHPGQYLNEGAQLTTLQSVDDAVHVDFTVAQRVAAGLREGESVDVFARPRVGSDGCQDRCARCARRPLDAERVGAREDRGRRSRARAGSVCARSRSGGAVAYGRRGSRECSAQGT